MKQEIKSKNNTCAPTASTARHLKTFLFFWVAMIIASCGTAPPLEPDWCYTFDFKVWDNDFSIPVGYQVDGLGIHSVFGALSLGYTHDSLVAPALISIKVRKAPESAGRITATAGGIVFGSSGEQTGTLDAGVTEALLWFEPAVVGDAGTDINVTVAVEDGINDIVIEYIKVEGFYESEGDTSPFPYNPCADPAEHPTETATPLDTSTPPPTNTPTATDTPTATFTPSDTPDFTATWTPTNTLDPNPTPVSYPLCSPPSTCIYDPYEFTDAEINAQQWGYTREEIYGISGSEGGVDGGQACHKEGSSAATNYACGYRYYFNGDSISVTNVRGWFRHWSSNINYDSYMVFIVWFYDEFDNAYQCDLDILDDRPNYHTYYDYQEFNYSTAGCTQASNAYKMQVYFGATTGSNPHYTQVYVDNLIISVSDFDPPATYTPYGTVTPVPTTTITPYVVPTNTPFNYQPTVDLTETTATPTITLTATSTDFPQSTSVPYQLTMTVGAMTPTYTVEEIRENEAEWELLQEQQQSNNDVENLLQDILDAINEGNNIADGTSGTSGDGGGAGGESGTGYGDTVIASNIADFYSALSSSLTTVAGLSDRIGGLFSNGVAGAAALADSYYTAPPSSIDGLPQCMSAPLEHDICAIYYILDWTLFAPNTLGQYIVPLILAIMNTVIILRGLRYILRLVKRTEDVTR